MAATRPRTRLQPEARRDQLLDTARMMVVDHGLQAFTMEGLAKAAGVSAPLVYNYFASRLELLQALLKREYQRFVDESVAAVRVAGTFEEIVRVSVASNFDHHAPGNILPLLLSQPEIVRASSARIRTNIGGKTPGFSCGWPPSGTNWTSARHSWSSACPRAPPSRPRA